MASTASQEGHSDMTVMIGIDPHKATHTAVAIDSNEQTLERNAHASQSSAAARDDHWNQIS